MRPIVLVAGARPNLMKIAPILRTLEARAGPNAVLVHTGQHYDLEMSDIFFQQLGIREPDVHLQVGSDSHGAQTGRIMASFEQHLLSRTELPRGVVVVGDVNSTMACALVAAKMGIPVAHVEAGLRSFDRTMPEEINRVVTDALADLLLVSEPAGMENLAAEGITPERIRYVGNVMIDSLVHQLPAARALDMVGHLGLSPGGYAVVTLHRPSNVDLPERLAALIGFLRRLSAVMSIVFPIHPRTHSKLVEFGLRGQLEGIPALVVSSPLGYRQFVGLMAQARVLISDSGGVQEEATVLGVPCVTLRTSTERPVTIRQGTNTLVGEDLELAWRVIEEVMGGRHKQGTPIEGWDGRAAERIVNVLLEAWGGARGSR